MQTTWTTTTPTNTFPLDILITTWNETKSNPYKSIITNVITYVVIRSFRTYWLIVIGSIEDGVGSHVDVGWRGGRGTLVIPFEVILVDFVGYC